MRRHPLALALVLALVLLASPRASACPACAGDPQQETPWAVIGGFLLVPLGLAVVVGLAIRRELRLTR